MWLKDRPNVNEGSLILSSTSFDVRLLFQFCLSPEDDFCERRKYVSIESHIRHLYSLCRKLEFPIMSKVRKILSFYRPRFLYSHFASSK